MRTTSYAIAIGSNRHQGRKGPPARVIAAALQALRDEGITITAESPVFRTPALGPAGRAFANAVALVTTTLPPLELLALLKRLESRFGRRRGRRWGARVLDLDIILWSKGVVRHGRVLRIPHPQFRRRGFVLDPLLAIAPQWRDPATGLTVRHLRARHHRPRAVDHTSGGQ